MPCNPKSLMKEQMKREYWRIYYDEMVAEQSDKIQEEIEIISTGVKIHIGKNETRIESEECKKV